MRIKGTNRGLAMALDGNERWCYLDPKLGASHAVAEAARKVACTGATPVAATNCLNFGNPEKPEIMAQLSPAIDGISEACLALGTPITGGNVSLYNETRGQGIYPTPVIGVVGILDQVSKAVGADFQRSRRRSSAHRSRIGSSARGAHAGVWLLGVRAEKFSPRCGGRRPAWICRWKLTLHRCLAELGRARPDPFRARHLRWWHSRCLGGSMLLPWHRGARQPLEGARSARGMGSLWRNRQPVHH